MCMAAAPSWRDLRYPRAGGPARRVRVARYGGLPVIPLTARHGGRVTHQPPARLRPAAMHHPATLRHMPAAAGPHSRLASTGQHGRRIADSALCGYRVQVAFAAVPIAGYGCHPGWLRVSAYRLGCGSGWSAQGGRYRGGRRERRLVAVSRRAGPGSMESGRPARGPARRRRAEASWGPGLPGITAAGAAGHRGHALVFGTATCVASAARGG